jgi:zinc transport system permease protein
MLYRQLMYVTFDEEQAKVSGLQIAKLSYLFAVLASVTVIVSMQLVGILLVSALIVIPNITALLLGKGFKKTALISVGISISSVVTGIAISYAANSPPSATIVLVLIAVFLATLTIRYSSKKQMIERMETARN